MTFETYLGMDDHIKAALQEDMPHGDISTTAVVDARTRAFVSLVCKQDGVIAGLDVFSRVFELVDPSIALTLHVADGDEVFAGQTLATLEGGARGLLSGERVALNYLQRMSGVATYTRKVVRLFEGTQTKLVDTRKTTPGMRWFEKQAVRIGGASSHRFCLSDGVMLKDNHIAAAGGVRQAVEAAKRNVAFPHKVEVEVETLGMVKEAVVAGADIIMLDNMSPSQMREAIEFIDGRAEVECSGNVTLENARELADLGVDYVSCGALTHSAGILDLSLKGFCVLD